MSGAADKAVKLAIFASGRGSNFSKILQEYREGNLTGVEPVVLICDCECPAAAIARASHFSAHVVPPSQYRNKAAYEQEILNLLREYEVEFIALAGYMRIVGKTLLEAYPRRILNLHPSLLPLYPGRNSIDRAYLDRVEESGVTVHLIDEGVDTGPILKQTRVPLLPGMSSDEFEEAIHAAEHEIYPRVIVEYARKLRKEEKMKAQATALLSVYDKSGLVEFARQLSQLNYRLVSTGGSAKVLREAGLEVVDVSELTGFPEMMDGRVKTLHPKIHAGILARRGREDDLATLKEHGIDTIDLVCVNLYPFEKVLAAGAPEAEMIENIDIGGPTLLRAAAKNFRDVTVVSDPADYDQVLEALHADDADQLYALRRELAGKVFAATGRYDKMIAGWFADSAPAAAEKPAFPEQLELSLERLQELRYGENPHQQAAFYRFSDVSDLSLVSATQLHGKELSYNNIQDTNAALELLYEFERPAVVAVKHMNPCGLAVADDIDTAWREAYEADPVSIFGGIIAANREISAEMARAMHEIFLEIIIAPSFSEEALEILQQKKNIRLLTLPMTEKHPRFRQRFVSVHDGLLLQDLNEKKVTREDCKVMGAVEVPEKDWNDLLEAFAVVKHCKSNAIVLYKDGVTVGIGVGQSNRVGACRIAVEQAGEKARGAVLASDAFFPMPDTLELAVAAGIRAVIQPGGSLRDQDSVEVCDQAGIPMVATGFRHFKH